MRKKLTDRTLQSLKAEDTLYDVMDIVTPGFGVRVSPETGRRTFILFTRYPGSSNPTRRALGEYPSMTLEAARRKAQDWRNLIKQGKDPAHEEARQRAAEARKRAITFGAVFEDFAAEKLARERRGAKVVLDIKRDFMPSWASQPITEITPHDVREIVKVVAARGPYQAHNSLGHVRRLFSWAIDQHVYGIEISPCDRLKPKAIIGEKKPRSRVLTDDEVRALWRTSKRLPYPYGELLRMLLLTGQRHQEVCGARWREIDFQAKVWTIPSERFKSDAEHRVPLTDDVLALLGELPRFRKGDHLFSTTFGVQPTRINDKVKTDLDARLLRTLKAMARMRGEDPKRVELRGWVIHDLRRTLRTHLAALRIQDHVAEMVVGHGRKGIARVYDQHRYDSEMREALTAWSARLRGIVSPPAPKSADVVSIFGAR